MQINRNNSISGQCSEMAAILGIENPVNEQVLLAALADSNYAHKLLVCRGDVEFMQYLLANPPAVKAEEEKEISTTVLLGRAAESLVRWAGTGFSTVSNEIYEKRLNACNRCPDLKVPPGKQGLLYKMAGASINTKSICGQCGCVVNVKARRNLDTCPAPDDANPDTNRWGEPIPVSAVMAS